MSRYYRMSVTVEGHEPQHRQAIDAALAETWGFDDLHEHEGTLTGSGDNWLCGGETEEEFAERLAKVIWQANDGFCKVQIEATCLENLPYEEYMYDEESYRRLMPSVADTKTEGS